MKHDKFSIREFEDYFIPPARIKKYGLWLFGNRCDSPDDAVKNLPGRIAFSDVKIRCFHFCTIAHLTAGKGKAWLEDGTEKKMFPGDCVIVTNGVLNRYGGTNGNFFIEDTVNFSGPIAEMMQNAGILRSGVFTLGPVRKLKFIHELLLEGTIDSHLAAACKLQQLLMEIYLTQVNGKNAGKHPVDLLIQEINNTPEKWWSTSDLVEASGLSETHLRRPFLEKTGYSPKEYIDRRKMLLAGEMLQSTEKNIADVAGSFGYRDPFHFSRRFKELMGFSPKIYRKQFHGVIKKDWNK